ncbi:MAG: amidohydrolase family protein [Bryobacteraceae bacterium]|nr:amidohydrolase family protein [Solibacteraceae bacterium]MCO5352425.1 amidohydrolase family protein [Bryobacteraceae bacterium]
MNMKCHGIDALSGAHVEITASGSVIQSVDEQITPLPPGAPHLAPGFIDLQVNGYAGIDYCLPGASTEQIGASLQAQFATGVTRIYPTVITGPRDGMTEALRMLARARRELPFGEALEAFHVEGPFISADDGPRGAHPIQHVRPPDYDEFLEWQDAAEGHIRLVTLAAEWPEAPAFIEKLAAQGIVVAIGHSNPTPAHLDAAVRAGATLSTHLGNGSHATMRRHPNYLYDQMADDRLNATFIGDGIHLDKNFLKVAIRAKGLERSVLITDAVMPAGCPPGLYALGAVTVQLHPENRVTVQGTQQLAGSVLRMDRGVENLMRLCGLNLRDAITLATRNPARVGRVPNRLRGLQPGERADVVEFTFDPDTQAIEVHKTWLNGQLVFSA